MSLRDTAPINNSEPTDESYKRIIPGNGVDVPDIQPGATEGARLYFRWTDGLESAIRHGVKFWLNTGIVKSNGKGIRIPFVSPNPFQDFMISGRRGTFVGSSAASKGCPLSKLADQRHPVISNREFQGQVAKNDQGQPIPDVSAFHTIRAQVVKLNRDASGAVIMNNGRPSFQVQPEGLGLEFRQNWWEKFVNLLEPMPVEALMDDGMSGAPAAAAPKDLAKFMKDNGVKDLTRVIFFIYKRKKDETKPIDGKNTEYVVDFSDKVWITDADDVQPVDLLDWNKVYKVPTTEELEALVAKAENRTQVAGGAPVPAPTASAPSADSPGAYAASPLPTNQVPMDGSAPVAAAAPAAPATGSGNKNGKDPF